VKKKDVSKCIVRRHMCLLRPFLRRHVRSTVRWKPRKIFGESLQILMSIILESQVLVSTPEDLQKVIDSEIQGGCKTLQLLVSGTVKTITYCISKVVKDVYVVPCGFTGSPGALRIGSLSTYCGVKTYAWDRRPEGKFRTGRYQIAHGEGCYWEINDDREAARLLSEPTTASDLGEEELASIRNHASMFRDEAMRGPPVSSSSRATLESSGTASSASPGTDEADGTESWFSKCKAFLAVVIGAGAGVAGAGGAFWCSAGGFFMKGPLGFSLSAGYFSGAAIGGACMAGCGTSIAAAAAVYFIPWEKVFEYAKRLLFKVWGYICDVFSWIGEKMRTLASTVISMVTVSATPTVRGPAAFSA